MTADAAFWNELAERYARQPVEDPDAFERKIAITRARMRPDHVVLDIGCGTGSLALRLADAASAVHGLDVSEAMVRIANEKTARQGSQNVHFHVGAFDEGFRVFDAGALNGVCAYSLLHLMADRASALRRMFDLLAPGGFFIASTVCLGNSWVPYRPVLSLMHWMGRAPFVSIVSTTALVEEIRAAGFTDVEVVDVGAKHTIAFTVAHKPG